MHKTGEQWEKIGKVTLDKTFYPGEDYYCDGEIEQELLDIVQTKTPEEYEALLRERTEWPLLYHLSAVRGNVVEWLPFSGTEKVLEIGSGPGAITAAVAPRVAELTCVELSLTRARIAAHRNKDRDNLTIRVGNYEDIEPHLDTDYDYVLLIGVMEYAQSYFHTREDAFAAELKSVRRHLKPGGHLVIAIENRLGLKYFAGCREDHTARYFDGIEGYVRTDAQEMPAARTFSKPALCRLLKDNGFGTYRFYYPYPDYKFMSTLYSDDRLPTGTELHENLRNFDHDRLLLFDERQAYRTLLADGLYDVFANSFLVVTGDPLPVLYCKYSAERAPQYRIRTRILKEAGETVVEKVPLHPAAADHVAALATACEKLKERYAGTRLHVADCRERVNGVVFPLVPGVTLESLLDARLGARDAEGFLKLLREYRQLVGHAEETPFADRDMTFANLLVEGEQWTAIDYEWAAEEPVSAKEALFRALHVYFLEDPQRRSAVLNLIGEDRLYRELGITPDGCVRLAAAEKEFQEAITAGVIPLGELRAVYGKKVIVPTELAAQKAAALSGRGAEAKNLATVQIYEDTGAGFREETSYFVDEPYQGEGMIAFSVEVEEAVKRLRVDPALCPCLVVLHDVRVGGISHKKLRKLAVCNGIVGRDGDILFTTDDPCLEWDMHKVRRTVGKPKGTLRLSFVIQMTGLPASMAKSLRDNG